MPQTPRIKSLKKASNSSHNLRLSLRYLQENTLSENNSTVHELPISDESVQTDWLKKFIVVLGKINKI